MSEQFIRDILGSGRTIVRPVGSRVTCNPAPTDTDEDYLVFTSVDAAPALLAAGFTQDGTPEFYTGNDNGGFRSFRRGSVNVITTQDMEFFDLFLTATALAKRFNLLAKGDRIALFQAILYGVAVDDLQPSEIAGGW